MGGRRGRRRPAAPLPATRLAPKGSRSSHWPCSQAHPRKAFPNAYVLGKKKDRWRILGISQSYFQCFEIYSNVDVLFPLPLLLSLRPSSVWQRLMRELLTFEARALGSNYLLRYPLYVSPLPTQRHDARMDLAAWDRCKCLLRPPSTSGCTIRSPSSSPGEPAEGAGFLGLELAPLRAQREQNLPPKRGQLGDSAAVVWPISPSVRGRTGSNQPSTSLRGLLPIPLLRRPAWDCRRRGRKTEFGELNYLSKERDIPIPCRLLRLGVSRGGCSGLFCQTQGATERELPSRKGKAGRLENRSGRAKLEGQWGYTQRVTFAPRIPTAVRGGVALPLGQATPPQGGIPAC